MVEVLYNLTAAKISDVVSDSVLARRRRRERSLLREWPESDIHSNTLCRRYRKLLLWTGPSNETSPDTDGTQPDSQLWVVQKDGDLRKYKLVMSIFYPNFFS